jgi:transcription termination factor NusB
MFRICLVKLSNVICNINVSGNFGLWTTKNQTTDIQIPIPVQQYYDMTLDDPFPSFSMQTFNVGTMICDYLKNLIEAYVDNNRTISSCTNLDQLLLLVCKLEITYMPIDNDVNVLHMVTH